MRAWEAPFVPRLPDGGSGPVLIHDSSTQQLEVAAPGASASLYACGITPYDATHIGHANTYVAFDLLVRAWLDSGKTVNFAQNITDVDDPLLERATATGVDWRALAASQIELFREDMAALRVTPPQNWITVTEAMPQIIDAVSELVEKNASYFDSNTSSVEEQSVDCVSKPRVAGADDNHPNRHSASMLREVAVTRSEATESAESTPQPDSHDVYPADSHDVYFDLATDPEFGTVAKLPMAAMLERFKGHGGDPERPGKHNELDPILWRAHRPGEPEWDGGIIGIGRPGWHIGCTVIAHQALGVEFDVTGGGRDLLFPHHEMSASLARVLYDDAAVPELSNGVIVETNEKPASECGSATEQMETRAGAKRFMHCGLISYQGEKMSKSLGNLVLVSKLREQGVDPMAIRLTLLSHHYRDDWEWTDQELANATARLNTWRAALNPSSFCARSESDAVAESQLRGHPFESPHQTISAIRAALANDLNAPLALDVVDTYFNQPNRSEKGNELINTAVDSLLGIKL